MKDIRIQPMKSALDGANLDAWFWCRLYMHAFFASVQLQYCAKRMQTNFALFATFRRNITKFRAKRNFIRTSSNFRNAFCFNQNENSQRPREYSSEISSWHSEISLRHSEISSWHSEISSWHSEISLGHSEISSWHNEILKVTLLQHLNFLT